VPKYSKEYWRKFDLGVDKTNILWYNKDMKKRINKLDKTRRLIKLSPNSEAYKSKMKRDKLNGNPDIYQSVGMDWKSVQDASDMMIDIDEFFENHLAGRDCSQQLKDWKNWEDKQRKSK
jgi:hypothetical protein